MYIRVYIFFFQYVTHACVPLLILVYKKGLERDRKKPGELILKRMMRFKLLIVYYSYNML